MWRFWHLWRLWCLWLLRCVLVTLVTLMVLEVDECSQLCRPRAIRRHTCLRWRHRFRQKSFLVMKKNTIGEISFGFYKARTNFQFDSKKFEKVRIRGWIWIRISSNLGPKFKFDRSNSNLEVLELVEFGRTSGNLTCFDQKSWCWAQKWSFISNWNTTKFVFSKFGGRIWSNVKFLTLEFEFEVQFQYFKFKKTKFE